MREVSLFVTFFSFFLPRDATHSAVMRLHVVCLSVRHDQVPVATGLPAADVAILSRAR